MDNLPEQLCRYKVFDLEVENYVYKGRLASPFYDKNYIVATGWKDYTDSHAHYMYFHNKDEVKPLQISEDIDVLVGHNVKFDLFHIYKDPDFIEFIKRGGRVWCTQYAEYLLGAHIEKLHMNAMDDIITKYGGRKKFDEVKAMWDEGIPTSEIPKDLLIDYLVGTEEEERNSGDIGNTELIFRGQVEKAIELGMLQIILERMDGYLATMEMEYNGLYIDTKEAVRRTKELHAERKQRQLDLNTNLPEMPEALTFNWNSAYHKSALFFGGWVKYKERGPYLDDKTGELARYKASETRYMMEDGSLSDFPVKEVEGLVQSVEGCLKVKSGPNKGKPRTKKVPVLGKLKEKWLDKFFYFKGLTEPDKRWISVLEGPRDTAIYSVNKDNFDALKNRGIDFISKYVEYMNLCKELTYYMTTDKSGNPTGMLTCVREDVKIVNHNLNVCSTVTGRLSSSNPNLQNIPRADKSEIKKVFTSRFGDDGGMIEADYSQLEVVVQGVLSKDKQLCIDLQNRVDFHCKRVAAKEGCTYEEAVEWCKNEEHPNYPVWKVKRTHAKNFSFQRAYGAGARGISESTGIPLEDVEALIIAEERMYPTVVAFNDSVEKACRDSAEPFYDAAKAKTYRRGYWQAPTGTRYSWRSYDAMDWQRDKGIQDSFMPTEIKNYPIQGTGGEMVQVILGKLFRAFVKLGWWSGNPEYKALLVNTVHDCIWADVRKEVSWVAGQVIRRVMESIPEHYNKTYGMDITVPFPVDVEYGENMLSLKELH